MPPYSRRTALQLIAAGSSLSITGCVGLTGGSETYPTVRVEGDAVPSDIANVNVEVVKQFSEASPAEIRVTFTNISETAREFPFTASPPFSGYYGQQANSDATAVLVPLQSEDHVHANINDPDGEGTLPPTALIPNQPLDGCWQAKASISGHPIAMTRQLSPDESLSETYALLAASVGEDSCPMRGEYRFVGHSYFKRQKWGFSAFLE